MRSSCRCRPLALGGSTCCTSTRSCGCAETAAETCRSAPGESESVRGDRSELAGGYPHSARQSTYLPRKGAGPVAGHRSQFYLRLVVRHSLTPLVLRCRDARCGVSRARWCGGRTPRGRPAQRRDARRTGVARPLEPGPWPGWGVTGVLLSLGCCAVWLSGVSSPRPAPRPRPRMGPDPSSPQPHAAPIRAPSQCCSEKEALLHAGKEIKCQLLLRAVLASARSSHRAQGVRGSRARLCSTTQSWSK